MSETLTRTAEPAADLAATMAEIGRRARDAAAALALASAEAKTAALRRGCSETFQSSRVAVASLRKGLHAGGLPEYAIQLVPTCDRASVGLMLKIRGVIDIIAPCGGASLIERVQRESRIPVIAH